MGDQETQDQLDHQELHHLDQLDPPDHQDLKDHGDRQVPKDQEGHQELQLHHLHHVLQSVQHCAFQPVHNTAVQQERRSNFKHSVMGFSLCACNILRFIQWFGLYSKASKRENIFLYIVNIYFHYHT